MSKKGNGCTAPVRGHKPGSDSELSCPVHRSRGLARSTKARLGGVLLVPPSQRDDDYSRLTHGDTHPESGLIINTDDLLLPGRHNIGQEAQGDVVSAYADGTPGIWEGTVFDGCNIYGSNADFSTARVKIRNSYIQGDLSVRPGSEVSDTSISGGFLISTGDFPRHQRGGVVPVEDRTLVTDCRVSGTVNAHRARLVRVHADSSGWYVDAYIRSGSVVEGGSWGKLWLDDSEVKGDGTSPAKADSIIVGYDSCLEDEDGSAMDSLVTMSDVNVKESIAIHAPVQGSATAGSVVFMIKDDELPDGNVFEVTPPKDSLLLVHPEIDKRGEPNQSLPKSLSVDPNLFYFERDMDDFSWSGKKQFMDYEKFLALRGRLAHGDPPLSARNNAAIEYLNELGGISRGRVNKDLLKIALALHENPA